MIELYELNPHKMTTPQEKAQCVSWFIETKSDVQTQRNYRSKYGRDPPLRPSIRLWHKKLSGSSTDGLHRRTLKSLPYTLDVFFRCSWSPTPPCIEHCSCLHKFLVP